VWQQPSIWGAYGHLGETHAAIREWCAQHGHRLSNVSWEIYGHWQESWNTEPSQIHTDIFYVLDDQKQLNIVLGRTECQRNVPSVPGFPV
jgi:hypothetical protein